jgi:hypothetical protein
MNKLIKTSLVALALTATSANAGLFDSVMTSSWPTVESRPYSLGVYGFDARVFEWTPLDNPNVRCVFVASNKSSGVACYDVLTTK